MRTHFPSWLCGAGSVMGVGGILDGIFGARSWQENAAWGFVILAIGVILIVRERA